MGGQNNVSATTDPQSTDDFSGGYAVGSLWINTTTDRAHICTDATTGSAVWAEVTLIPPSNVITPKVTNTVDIGSGSLQFKDIYIDGSAYLDSIFADNIATTANLSVGGTATIANLTTTGTVSIGSTIAITGGTIDGTPNRSNYTFYCNWYSYYSKYQL